MIRKFLNLLLISAFTAASPAASAGEFWHWFAEGMRFGGLEHPRIDRWESRIRDRATEWTVTLASGRDHFYPIAAQFSAADLPMELALIPAIESRFEAHAASGAGAAGYWQMMPATAKHLGLKTNWWLDERSDLIASTRAALTYLSYLHGRFGDWPLALAAYNSGESRVAAAIRKNARAGKPTDFWNLDLPREADDYVPKLLALARIVQRPGKLRLPFVENRATIAAIDAGGPLNLDRAAELAGVSVATLYRLNPQLRRFALAPQGPYRLYLPSSHITAARTALAALTDKDRAKWITHRVRSGDTLSEIAKDHASSVRAIQRANGLESTRIRVNRDLLVPGGVGEISRATASAATRRSRLSYRADAPEEGIHIVARGETLWSIARRLRMSVARLRALNSLEPGTDLMPGQRLLISHPADQTLVYVVRPGDALSRIARRYEVQVRDIQRWNDLGRDLLVPGQQLTLFLKQ